MGELHWLTATEAGALMRAGEITSRQLGQDTLDWIAATGQVTRAWVELTAESALAEAEAADALLKDGTDLGPFHGMTYSVKDVIAVKDVPMLCGSKIPGHHVPQEDATVVARMRAAGAVCLGKVATHELSWGGTTAVPARNPWDGASVPGGSSGGSGAAVAAGQGQASIGGDCGCSVRNPAGLNGIFGMRVTHGRVPTTGSVPLSMTMDTLGPLARSLEDLAAMLGVIAGYDPLDITSSAAPVPDFAALMGQGIEGLRIGVPTDHFFDHIETDVADAVRAALTTMQDDMGAVLVEVPMPHAGYAGGAFLSVIAESATLFDEYTFHRAEEFGIDVRNFAELGELLLAKDYLRSQQVRNLVRRDFERAFAGVDLLITPTTAATAKPPVDHPIFIDITYPDGHSEDALWAYCRYTVPVSMSGCPALIVPCGFDGAGMPISMQVVGPAFDEATTFRLGAAYTAATDWVRRPSYLMQTAAA